LVAEMTTTERVSPPRRPPSPRSVTAWLRGSLAISVRQSA
jgi:hypothetical protein